MGVRFFFSAACQNKSAGVSVTRWEVPVSLCQLIGKTFSQFIITESVDIPGRICSHYLDDAGILPLPSEVD